MKLCITIFFFIIVLVPRPVQHHVIVNQSMASSGNMIQSSPQISTSSAVINQVATATINSHSQPQIISQLQQQPQISIGNISFIFHIRH